MSSLDMLLSLDTKPAASRYPLLDLVTRMPVCCTCAGSNGVASCNLFCTCTCAMSGLVPAAKVSVVVAWPESSALDERYSRWSSPLICCSITCTTVFSTVSAEAPAYVDVIWIDGGAMVGYCSIGIERIDNPPDSMNRIAITIAKIGRQMK